MNIYLKISKSKYLFAFEKGEKRIIFYKKLSVCIRD